MRILVFSDSHSDVDSCIDVIERIKGVDMVLHAGDCLRDALTLERAYPDMDIRCVAGNCDFGIDDKELIIETEGKRIFLTHGDLYGVKTGYSRISYKAEEIGADIAVFGHSHIPLCEEYGSVMLLNPGSIRYSRTYGVIEIEDGELRACVIDL